MTARRITSARGAARKPSTRIQPGTSARVLSPEGAAQLTSSRLVGLRSRTCRSSLTSWCRVRWRPAVANALKEYFRHVRTLHPAFRVTNLAASLHFYSALGYGEVGRVDIAGGGSLTM